ALLEDRPPSDQGGVLVVGGEMQAERRGRPGRRRRLREAVRFDRERCLRGRRRRERNRGVRAAVGHGTERYELRAGDLRSSLRLAVGPLPATVLPATVLATTSLGTALARIMVRRGPVAD